MNSPRFQPKTMEELNDVMEILFAEGHESRVKLAKLLGNVGVDLSLEQKSKIMELIETNKVAEAQSIIIDPISSAGRQS